MTPTSGPSTSTPKTTWEAVLDELDAGRIPTITVSEKTAVAPPKSKRGRPRTVNTESPYMQYAAAVLTGGLVRPRCMHPRCKKKLKASDRYVCSESCREEARRFFRLALLLLDPKRPATITIPGAPKPVPDVPQFGAKTHLAKDIPADLRAGLANGRGRPKKKRGV